MVHDPARGGQLSSFAARIRARAHAVNSWLCVGLDPDPARLPASLRADTAGVTAFCHAIIDATHDLAAAFKINFAFFEALGIDGWRALHDVRAAIPGEIPVIADAKRGDIANTAAAYARAVFDVMACDAVTVSPYLGWDSVQPFAAHAGRGVLVLCKTSNPGSPAFQDVAVDGGPLYLKVAREGIQLACAADVGLVVGATRPDALRAVRALSEQVLLLVPGVGAQGAETRATLSLAANRIGDNAIVPISREIMYASGGADFAQAARSVAAARAVELWAGRVPS